MSVRFIVQGTFRDYEQFSTLAKRFCEHVETNEPGTLAYEWFASAETGTYLVHQIYADDDAFLAHMASAQEDGRLDEMMSIARIEQVTGLNRVHSDAVGAIFDQFDSTRLHGLAGVTR